MLLLCCFFCCSSSAAASAAARLQVVALVREIERLKAAVDMPACIADVLGADRKAEYMAALPALAELAFDDQVCWLLSAASAASVRHLNILTIGHNVICP